jgi:hypothetical protein
MNNISVQVFFDELLHHIVVKVLVLKFQAKLGSNILDPLQNKNNIYLLPMHFLKMLSCTFGMIFRRFFSVLLTFQPIFFSLNEVLVIVF